MEVGDMGGGAKDKIRFLLNPDFALSSVLGVTLVGARGSMVESAHAYYHGISEPKGSWASSGGSTVTNQAGAVFSQLHLELGSWRPRADVVEIVRLHLF